MITAHKARELAQQSDSHISNLLEKVGAQIEKAAKLGKHKIVLDFVLPYHNELKMPDAAYVGAPPPALSPLQKRLVDKFIEHGYSAGITYIDHDPLGGLGNMGDDPRPTRSFHIIVEW